MYFLFLLVLINYLKIISCQNPEEVDYFVKVVEDGIEQAYTFALPTSAEAYRPKRLGLQCKSNIYFVKRNFYCLKKINLIVSTISFWCL